MCDGSVAEYPGGRQVRQGLCPRQPEGDRRSELPTQRSWQEMVGMARPSARQPPKRLDQLRQALRTRHYSDSTEQAYVHWSKRFIFFHRKRHPAEMGEAEIATF